MSIRHTLSTLYYLPVLVGLTLGQIGCDGVSTPDKIITDNPLNLPALKLTSLTDSGDGPALVGIGSSLKITWELTGTISEPVIKIYLQPSSGGQMIEITPEQGVDGNAKEYNFTPKKGQGQTGVDYNVVVRLYSKGNIFDEKTASQQLRIGDGGIIINTPAGNLTLARGLPVGVTWELTNNICEELKDKLKVVRLYIDTTSQFNESTAIEVIEEGEEVDACLGTYSIKTGEVEGLQLGRPYYVLARLYIDGIEAARASSAGAFTATSSLNVTAPEKEVIANLQAIPVSWEVVGRSSANLSVEILAQLSGAENDSERVVSQVFAADQGRGLADASKLPSGTYNLVVRLFNRDEKGAKVVLDTAAAPGWVVIPNGYNGTFDLADMAAVETTNYSPVDGLVFEGFNIDEQLGFEVAGVGDITGDGFADFLIFSRFDQQYTTGNAGGAYLIHGKQSFEKKVINVNSVASPGIQVDSEDNTQTTKRVVDGSILLFPMENLATMEPGTNNIRGRYTAIGLPDVSNDGKGDILIGCPDAAPLAFHYQNKTSGSVDFIDHYGLRRSIPGSGTIGYEPAHVPPGFTMQLPQGGTLYHYSFNFGSQQDNYHYLPGDTVYVEFIVGPSTNFWIEHGRRKRGATYLLTSQRLSADEYKNSVYDLAKVGSPVEDGLNDPANGWSSHYIRHITGVSERSEMITWDSDFDGDNFGYSVSVMGDINADNYPELLISVPNSYAVDSADPDFSSNPTIRSEAGIVKFLGAGQRRQSLCSNNGTIAWMWPDWELVLNFNGTPQNSDGQDYSLDIIGAETGSELTGAAGLGDWIQYTQKKTVDGQEVEETVTQYVKGDYNDDQVPDFVVGAPGENLEAGCVYVVPVRPILGRRDSIIDLADFNQQIPPGTNPSMQVPVLGVKVQGTVAGERLGEIVKPAGDFNGDGLADVMFSTPKANAAGKAEAGRVFIMFGQKDQIGDFTLEDVDSHLGTELPALIFEGENEFDHFGTRIVAVYDVNGDGLDDILVAAPDADAPNKLDCGKIYLIYGKKNIVKTDPATGFKFVDYNNDGQPDDFWSVQDIGVELPGAVFIGEAAGNHLQAIAPAGDVNGDGINDFLVGSPNTNVSSVQKNAGKAYVVFGRKYVLPN